MLGVLLGGLGAALIVAHGLTDRGLSAFGSALLAVCGVPCDSAETGLGGPWLGMRLLPLALLWQGSEFSCAGRALLPVTL